MAAKKGAKRASAKKTSPKKAAAPRAGRRPPAAPSGDWRDATLARVRRVILEADPEAVEERKWRKPTNPDGVAVWSHGGILCTGEVYKDKVKLTFAKGAALPDPTRLFNASLEGNARRAIDLREGDAVEEAAFKELVRAAVALDLRAS